MVVVPLAPPVRIAGRSYMRSTSRVRKMTATARAGLTSGNVILVNRCQAVAPSPGRLVEIGRDTLQTGQDEQRDEGVVFQSRR